MEDLRIGQMIRSLRLRLGWKQVDLAGRVGCSAAAVGRIERGHLSSLPAVRAVAAALDVRVDLVPRWRGGELDRMLNPRHGLLSESVARHLKTFQGWTVRPEVSFSIFGERGVIDLFAWHPGRAMLVVIELKTELVDISDLLATMDRRRRLAPRIGRDLGWQAASVSSLVLLVGTRTNRRRVAEHRAVLRAAFPSDGRRLSGWLGDPLVAVSMLAMWPDPLPRNAGPASRTASRSRGRPESVSEPIPRTVSRPISGPR